jgi:hypothetical protein
VIQVVEPWFWGGQNPEIGLSTQSEWSSVATRYFTLKNLSLSSYLSQLPVKPLPVLLLSPECTFLVAPALAFSRHDGWVSMQKVYWDFRFCV